MVMVLNTRPAVVPIRMNSPNTATIIHIASRTSGAELRPAASLRSSGTMHEIGDPGRDADHGRHQERAAPADPRGQRRGDAGGERHADIAADAVEGERAPAVDRAATTIAVPTG